MGHKICLGIVLEVKIILEVSKMEIVGLQRLCSEHHFSLVWNPAFVFQSMELKLCSLNDCTRYVYSSSCQTTVGNCKFFNYLKMLQIAVNHIFSLLLCCLADGKDNYNVSRIFVFSKLYNLNKCSKFL